MTINDMLDARIVFEGAIEIRAYINENKCDKCFVKPWEHIHNVVNKAVLDMEVLYMFSELNDTYGNILIIEVNAE